MDEAIADALLVFENGLFEVLVDDSDVPDLDSPVTVNDDTAVMFVRLVALSGG